MPPNHDSAPLRPGAIAIEEVRVVGAAILDRGRCFAAERGPTMSASGLWELPGGKVEEGEQPRDALVREIREELGLEIRVGASLGAVGHREGARQLELQVFVAELAGGTLRPVEHSRCGWFHPASFGKLAWAIPDRPFLPKITALVTEKVPDAP